MKKLKYAHINTVLETALVKERVVLHPITKNPLILATDLARTLGAADSVIGRVECPKYGRYLDFEEALISYGNRRGKGRPKKERDLRTEEVQP